MTTIKTVVDRNNKYLWRSVITVKSCIIYTDFERAKDRKTELRNLTGSLPLSLKKLIHDSIKDYF